MGRRGFLAGLFSWFGYGAAKGAVPCEVAGTLRVSGPEVLERVAGVSHPLVLVVMDQEASLTSIIMRQDGRVQYTYSDGTEVVTYYRPSDWLDQHGLERYEGVRQAVRDGDATAVYPLDRPNPLKALFVRGGK